MQISTTRFGAISIDEAQVVMFSEGLPGFEETRRFVLLPHPGDTRGSSPFQWLQCVDGAPGTDALALPVVDPWLIDPSYAPTIPANTLRELDLEQMQGKAKFWAVVSVPRDHPEQATVNLLAPLLINNETRQARQVALLTEKYHLRTPLKPAPVTASAPHESRATSESPIRQLAIA